ncbi:anti-sigma factor domain-containing protein [Microbacterium sp. BLY]|uniref:anti-sigma factor n=1 Tax=Microbacterium sp. BLY TaxID=2823280 RepID=UPI001B32FBF1|nr:anti-sigma factor [Microbacterium sp. BLY]MBP3976090.1 anti-sigma factor [Microbacterium sp. BLY]
MNEKDFEELAAGAALHALSADDERRYRRALAEHPEWAATTERDAETAALLGDGVAPVAPPAGIRAALLAQIAQTPQTPHGDASAPAPDSPREVPEAESVVSADEPAPRTPRRWTRIAFALAACLALLVGVGIGAVALNAQLNRPASVVALQEIESADDAQQATVELDDGATATAHWSGSVGKAVLVTDGLPEVADGRTYELWFVRGEDPIAAGVFDVDDGEATALLEGEMQAGDAIAVTVEQEGGSPSGLPTTDPVIVIPTA